MATFIESYGPWALVTGASSGIGAEFAKQLAGRGMNLVLVARRERKLTELAQTLMKKHGVEVRVATADLARPDFLAEIVEITDSLEIGLLVNCAGFSVTGSFLHNDIQKELDMLHVNCRAPVLLAHKFGKLMAARKRGGIVFVSSSVAYSPVPFWTNYSATKVHSAFFGEGLSHELKQEGIDVLTVCPGGTKTEFQEVAGIRDTGAMSASSVVTSALRNLGKKTLIVPGWHNRFLYAGVSRLLPKRLKLWLFSCVIRTMQTKDGEDPVMVQK